MAPVGHTSALRQALADYVRWRDATQLSIRIAVNVSPLQLRNRLRSPRHLISQIRQRLNRIHIRRRTGLARQRLKETLDGVPEIRE